ncbi:MAG TPA: SDR family oxidoreductase [candidate division Zixibacteria bacterium]|nr:SDR family oxidoreductase [candidate division Zixibacteria bacterium]
MILQGKTAIVTGSSRGIGAATAKLLAQEGAKVAVNYKQNEAAGKQVLTEIEKAGGTGILIQADTSVREQVEALVKQTEKELGPVDILVNNANMSFPVQPFLEFPWDGFEHKLVHEMSAAFHCCQVAAASMAQRKQGCIVIISSGLSRHPGPGFIAHSSAKSALDAFSKSLALELGPLGIRVNVVAPGLTRTDATAARMPQMEQAVAQHTPLRRVGETEDIAGVVLFYCSEWANFVTGTYLPVNGGTQMN